MQTRAVRGRHVVLIDACLWLAEVAAILLVPTMAGGPGVLGMYLYSSVAKLLPYLTEGNSPAGELKVVYACSIVTLLFIGIAMLFIRRIAMRGVLLFITSAIAGTFTIFLVELMHRFSDSLSVRAFGKSLSPSILVIGMTAALAIRMVLGCLAARSGRVEIQ